MNKSTKIKCKFCGRSQHQVNILIKSPPETRPYIYICSQCVVICCAVLSNRAEGRDIHDFSWVGGYNGGDDNEQVHLR